MNYRKSEAKAAAFEQFRGVSAAIATPFTADDRLDEAGLRRNMRHMTDALQIDGIFCAERWVNSGPRPRAFHAPWIRYAKCTKNGCANRG